MHLVNHCLAGTRCFDLKRKLFRSIGYAVGNGTNIVGPVYCTGRLTIGDNCWVGRNFTVHGNGSVVIGNNCDIAPDVTILTGGHQIGNEVRRAGSGESYTIQIGDGVWIGARATLLGNIHIGSGSLVAACACVIRDVRQNMAVGGVPAKVIRDFENDVEKTTEK